jgi:hypothetical protein
MPVYYLRNSKAPDGKIVPITVSLNLEVFDQVPWPAATGTVYPNDPFPDTKDPEGEGIWVLTVSTSELDSSGEKIGIEVVNVLDPSLDTVHDEIQAAMGRIGEQIDWGTLLVDNVAPQLKSLEPPIEQTENVSIVSDVVARIIDPLPAAGLDLSTLNMSINGLPVISGGSSTPSHDIELRGNVFDTTVIFRPTRIL